ncbi:[histone H3]-lysine(4) N-trimethyltransferase [Ranunculus cassubicifolius]
MPRLNINPPFFSKRLDRRDRYSHREFGVKSFNVNNDRRTKRRFPVKSQYERQNVNQFHLEKHVAMRPSTERAIVQALMAAPNCPWRQGRDTFTSQDKTSKYIPTNCYNEYEDYFPVQGEASDSPYVKNILNRDPNATTFASDSRDDDIKISIARNKVRKTLRLFQILCRILLRDEEGKSKGFSAMRQTVLMAATILIENKKWINSGQQVMGPVPGVEIGDEFRYRVELAIVGLHQSYESEIDYIDSGGKKLATSIIASGSYDEFLDSSDILVYSGQGGNSTCGTKVTADQKLVGGNLALRNSKDERTPIRVIRGFREASSLDSKQNITTLVYDGLYLVEEYWKEKQTYGNIVFMFKLRRIHGQPELAIKQVKRMRKTSVRERVCVPDISRGTEMIPIAAVNTINNEAPRSFEYITRMNYSQCDKPTSPQGCNCVGGCFSSRNCSCIMKNGGRIPFNYNGAIVETMALVYECGPQCRCPPSCYNKVSQRGIKFSLEVFKTKSKGWGVRSLSSIPSGSFICEYTGKLLNEKEAGQMIGKDDEYLFNTGCSSKNDDALWEGLSDLLPSELRSSTSCKAVGYPGLAVDASQYGNIGRFINHSCSPNLYMQSILYDHHDRRMPHLMLFAAENIPPLQELTSNYNMGLDRVRDGNVRKFKCYCGSSECTGIGY